MARDKTLRELRRSLFLTVDEVALAASLSPYTVRQYERGTVLEPRFASIRAMARVYAIEPEHFLELLTNTVEIERKKARKLAERINKEK